MRSSGAAVECEKQRGGGVCPGAHPSKHWEDKGKQGVKPDFVLLHPKELLLTSLTSLHDQFFSLQLIHREMSFSSWCATLNSKCNLFSGVPV